MNHKIKVILSGNLFGDDYDFACVIKIFEEGIRIKIFDKKARQDIFMGKNPQKLLQN